MFLQRHFCRKAVCFIYLSLKRLDITSAAVKRWQNRQQNNDNHHLHTSQTRQSMYFYLLLTTYLEFGKKKETSPIMV